MQSLRFEDEALQLGHAPLHALTLQLALNDMAVSYPN